MFLQEVISSILFSWQDLPWDGAGVIAWWPCTAPGGAETGAVAFLHAGWSLNKKSALGKNIQWISIHLSSVGIDKRISQWKKPEKRLGKCRGRLETWHTSRKGTGVIRNLTVFHSSPCREIQLKHPCFTFTLFRSLLENCKSVIKNRHFLTGVNCMSILTMIEVHEHTMLAELSAV